MRIGGFRPWKWWSGAETSGLLVCEPGLENMVTEASLLKRSEYSVKDIAAEKLLVPLGSLLWPGTVSGDGYKEC